MLHHDARVSLNIARVWNQSNLARDARFPLLLIEWSAHGIPWLILSVSIFTYVCVAEYSQEIQWMWAVLLFGIAIDLAFVGLIKLAVRRPRPPYNHDDQIYEAPVADKFSFPSGHTSRATMICMLIVELLDVTCAACKLLIFLIPVILGLSRVALGRHYLSDVMAGHVLGIIEALIAASLPQTVVTFTSHYVRMIFQ